VEKINKKDIKILDDILEELQSAKINNPVNVSSKRIDTLRLYGIANAAFSKDKILYIYCLDYAKLKQLIIDGGFKTIYRKQHPINWNRITIWISIILSVLIPLLILFLKSSKQFDIWKFFHS